MELSRFDTEKCSSWFKEHGAQAAETLKQNLLKTVRSIGWTAVSPALELTDITLGTASRFVSLKTDYLEPTNYYENLTFRTSSSRPEKLKIDITDEIIRDELDSGRD